LPPHKGANFSRLLVLWNCLLRSRGSLFFLAFRFPCVFFQPARRLSPDGVCILTLTVFVVN